MMTFEQVGEAFEQLRKEAMARMALPWIADTPEEAEEHLATAEAMMARQTEPCPSGEHNWERSPVDSRGLFCSRCHWWRFTSVGALAYRRIWRMTHPGAVEDPAFKHTGSTPVWRRCPGNCCWYRTLRTPEPIPMEDDIMEDSDE